MIYIGYCKRPHFGGVFFYAFQSDKLQEHMVFTLGGVILPHFQKPIAAAARWNWVIFTGVCVILPSFPGRRCIFRLVFTYIRVILCRFPGVLQLGAICFYTTPCNSAHFFPDRTTVTVLGFTHHLVNPHKKSGVFAPDFHCLM